MKKRFLFVILMTALLGIIPLQASVKTMSRNRQDHIKIIKITPRTLSYMLKPINCKVFLEADYNLKTKKEGIILFRVFKVTGKDKMEEVATARKTYPIKGGIGRIRLISGNLSLPEKDESKALFMVISLAESSGKEVAFSSSKNFIGGTYKIFPDSKTPETDSIRRIDIQPRPNSEIETGKETDFHIILEYSLQSKSMAFVDVLFQDMGDMGSARAIKSVTATVPRGRGKISLKPTLLFENDLAGKSFGTGIFFWTNPLDTARDVIQITEFFFRKKR